MEITRAQEPKAVFGLPAYNHAHKLPEALNSLLNQTEANFCVIASDDCSTDETAAILAQYAEQDRRVLVSRTDKRLGYIGNARRCFELARLQFPAASFFAWASDHDIWDPRWLKVLIEELECHPDAVIACPGVHRIDAENLILSSRPANCCTVGEHSTVRRFRTTFQKTSPGNMIYGLFRAEALERAGGLPWHLLPDRLALALLSLQGSLIAVPDFLWYRRYRGLASIERQIRASFPERVPLHIRWPWWIAHAGHICSRLVILPNQNSPVGRMAGLGYSLLYLWLGGGHVLQRRVLRPTRRKLRNVIARKLPGSVKAFYRGAGLAWHTSTRQGRRNLKT